MDLGTALDCQSYGPVTSTGGNYVGGIAGWSDAPVPLRLLSPGGGKVWQRQNGRWQLVETTLNGQYLLLAMTGTQGTFCVQPARSAPWPVLAAPGGAAVLAVLLLIAGKRRRTKKAAKKEKAAK